MKFTALSVISRINYLFLWIFMLKKIKNTADETIRYIHIHERKISENRSAEPINKKEKARTASPINKVSNIPSPADVRAAYIRGFEYLLLSFRITSPL